MPERPGVRIRIEKAPLHRSLKLAAMLAIAGLLDEAKRTARNAAPPEAERPS